MTSGAISSNHQDHELSDLERKLKEGHELTLEVNKRGSANISVLSTPAAAENNNNHYEVSAKSSYSDGDDLDDAEIASKSNLELLEQTQRLLDRMQLNQKSSASLHNNNSTSYEDNERELNEMLDKAGQLSSMMQSISENISLNNGDTPSLVQKYRQDPPPSVNTARNAACSPSKEDRPTSSVNVMQSADDDVSSVGSASLHFSRYTKTPTHTGGDEMGTNNNHEKVEEDDLFGDTPRPASSVPKLNTSEVEEPQLKAPTSPGGKFSIASSPRDATPDGVEWEKVETAKEGEEDYVPLVDYSHIKPTRNQQPVTVSAGSRLTQLRKRNAARRRHRIRAMVAVTLVAVAGFVYVNYFSGNNAPLDTVMEEEATEEYIDEPEEEVIMQTFDTSYLQGYWTNDDGFCFEGLDGDETLLVTFPKSAPVIVEEEPVVEEIVEEEKPRRGLFGGRRNRKK